MRRVLDIEVSAPPLGGLLSHAIAVEEDLAPGRHFPERLLTHGVIMQVLGGRCRMTAEGLPFSLAQGGLIALAQGQRNSETIGDEVWRTRYLMLRGPWPALLDQALAERPGRALLLAQPPAAAVQALAETVSAAFERPEDWPWRVASGLAGLLGILVAACRQEEAPGLVEDIARLVDTDPERAWRTGEVARRLGLPLSTLAHAFSRVGDLPLAAWLRQRRLLRAQVLLRQGLAVTAVAERMGFANPFHFSRAYARQWGHPPSGDRGGVSPLHHHKRRM